MFGNENGAKFDVEGKTNAAIAFLCEVLLCSMLYKVDQSLASFLKDKPNSWGACPGRQWISQGQQVNNAAENNSDE
jgi:hypothetical protein